MFNVSARASDIKIISSASGNVDYYISWGKTNLKGKYTTEHARGNITTATTTLALEGDTSPARVHYFTDVRSIILKNKAETSNTLTVIVDTDGTITHVTSPITLLQNECALINDYGLHIYTATGLPKTA